ncbi:hypothetical protein B0H17DRAFT_1209858 [Mycena rosella]|uniref:Uncharacterized protein n=1 Tax=Mycena rosella TaxID=1033263 RepID=A0AAD7D193_MYCRO|nr:hypothetical protein B0H17DRAFT_1209858 [Mycena rosella]
MCTPLNAVTEPLTQGSIREFPEEGQALAQRARAASRIPEAQVSVNPLSGCSSTTPASLGCYLLRASPHRSCARHLFRPDGHHHPVVPADPLDASLEWLRRTTLQQNPLVPRVLYCARGSSMPLPLPLTPTAKPQRRRRRPRAGTLVSHWAVRAGIAVLPIAPSTGPQLAPRRCEVRSAAAALAVEVSPRVVRVLARRERLDVAVHRATDRQTTLRIRGVLTGLIVPRPRPTDRFRPRARVLEGLHAADKIPLGAPI